MVTREDWEDDVARARRVVCARGRRLDGGYYFPDELGGDVIT